MAKKRSIKNDSSTFATQGKAVKEALEDIDSEEIGKNAIRGVNFDAHFVTERAILFGKALTGVPLYRYQEDTAYAILYNLLTFNNDTLSMLFSRQSGKTETLAFCINTVSVLFPTLAKFIPDLEAYKDGVCIGLFAPQSDQVWTTYNRALSRLTGSNAELIMGEADIEVSLDKPTRYELSNGSKLIAQTASKQSKIEGATYHWVILEEAQDIDTYIVQKSIQPMVTATAGTILKCGTTGTEKNHFWYDIEYNKRENRKIKDPRLRLHWEFDYIHIIKDKHFQYTIDKKIFHLNYEKAISKEILRYGKDSQYFQLNYALQWDLESGMLITDKQFAKLCNNRKGLFNILPDDVIIAGLDIGKESNNTVLTLGKMVWDPTDEEKAPKKEVVGWIEIPLGTDYDEQHKMIVDSLYEYEVTNMWADYTGVGKPVVDRLAAALGDTITINPFTFSKQSKSDMWYLLVEAIQSGNLVIPANKSARQTEEFQHFEEQMKACIKTYDGTYLVCHKSDGYLDDYVDSLGLMNMADNFEMTEEIEEEDNPIFEDHLATRRNYNPST